MQVFNNQFFSVEMPNGWKVDETYDGMALVSDDVTKSLIIKIFNSKAPSPLSSLAKKKNNFTVIRDEYFNLESTGYSFCEGVYKESKINYKSADFMLLNKDVLVYLSLGDYSCNDENCSSDTINGIINSFYVIDSSGDRLKLNDLRKIAN